MKKSKRIKLSKKSLITRIVIYSIISVLSIVSICIVPKTLFSDDFLYEKAVKYAKINEKDDISLHHYDVFANAKRFNAALETEIPKQQSKFRDKNDVLLVKIPGENKTIRYKNYIFIQDESVPPLNIEYYAVKNLTYKTSSLPIATFLASAKDINKKVNYVYIPLLVIIHLAFLLPFGINDGFYIKELVDRNKRKQNI